MIITETARLILRTWTLEDVDFGLAIWGNKEVVKHIGLDKPLDREGVLETIKKGIDHQMRNGYQHWAVMQKDTNEIIGACGFNEFHQVHEHERSIELVFHFMPKAWGQGYATEAAEACLNYAHEFIKSDRIIAGVEEGNIRSIRVLDKLGFQYLGLVYFDDTKTFEPMYEFRLTPQHL